jgi:uncharacterized protein YecT (DUF1311 family)
MSDWIEQLERLTRLNRDGALTDAEFAEQKARLLAAKSVAGSAPTPAPSYASYSDAPAPAESSGISLTWLLVAALGAVLLGVLAWTQLIDSKGEVRQAPLPGVSSGAASDGASVTASTATSAGATTAPPLAAVASSVPTLTPSAIPTIAAPQVAQRTFNPSFNCAGQHDNVLLMICRSEELSRKDRLLSERFRAVLRQADSYDRQSILKSQRGYLRERATCQDSECLYGWYDRVTAYY